MTKPNGWLRIVNLLGAAAYFMIVIQWFWLLVTTLVPVIASEEYQGFITPQRSEAAIEPLSFQLTMPPFVQMSVVVLSVIFAIGVSLYALYLVPRTVSRAGRKSVNKVAVTTVDRTTRHQSIKPRQKQILLMRYTWLVKSLAIVLPLLLALLPLYDDVDIEHSLVVIVAGFFAVLSLFFLGLQLLVGYLARVPVKNLR